MKQLTLLLWIVLVAAVPAWASSPPVKVFILAGQSNMAGAGQIRANPNRNGGKGSLEYLVKNPETAPRFGHLVDASGQWRTRNDVWIVYFDRKGPLTVGFGGNQETIGPELGFGWVVGDALEEPVLLIKCAWGGKSLAVDFRPPSAGKPPYSLGQAGDAAIAQDPTIIGKYYREILALTRAALADIKQLVPGSDGRYVLAGFGWHQGWNDRINDKFNAEYENNLVHFIRDIRKDLGAPGLPFVIAETGMTGPEETHPRALALMKAQAAVAQREEFQGNVAFVSTRAFWRPADQSPSGQGYHWNSNAETYYLIGEAMGRAMLKLLAGARSEATSVSMAGTGEPQAHQRAQDHAGSQEAMRVQGRIGDRGSPVDRADWPQFQRNAARHGRTPVEVAPPYRARWIWFGPDWVLRNRESERAPTWDADLSSAEGKNYPMPPSLPFSFAGSMQPICVAGRVFVADCQGTVYAIRGGDGATLWTADNPGGSLWPGVATEQVVVFASVLGVVTAWDAATGTRRWQYDTGKSITSAPALVDETVYVASQSGRVYALHLADGKELWKSVDLGAPIQGGLCVAQGRVYVGTEAMEAVALDATNGKPLARSDKLMGQSFRLVWPVAVGNRVIFTTVPIVCVGSEYVNDPVIAGKDPRFGSVGWDPQLKPGYPDVKTEQAALRRWLNGEGRVWQTHYALRADDLKQDYIIATGVTEGCGMPPNPPTVDHHGRPLLWWASGHGTVIRKCGFGTNFTTDISALDLDTGDRVLIDNHRYADQTTETDNLYAMSTGGRYLYLRQNFRGTSAINLQTSEHYRISAIYRRWDGGGWHSPINYAQGDGGQVRAPRTPRAPEGRVAPTIADGRLYFAETFCVTCVESAR